MIAIRFYKMAILGAIMIGIGCAAFFYFTFLADMVRPDVRIFDVWIPAVVLIFMLIYIRSFRPIAEPFHFWEGLILGNVMLWLGGLISGLLIWQISTVDSRSFDHYIQSCIRYLEMYQAQAPEKQKLSHANEMIADWQKSTPSSMVWDEFKRKLQYSLVLVPLISVFIRRK